jgi:predicted CxxxxCH...CXXCH cytochrome family protein
VYANIAGAHAAHIALTSAGTPISCDTCHNLLGPNLANLNHYNRANGRAGAGGRVPPGDVAFLITYNAKSGASSFDNSAALNCSNVSCHGGQATPNWQTGTLDVNTQCTNCHASGTAQFNSNNSGEHNLHSAYTCTECHDMNVATNNTAGVSNHFKFLSTSAMEGPAKDTFRNTTGSVVFTPGATAGTGTCNGTCHGMNHSPESW